MRETRRTFLIGLAALVGSPAIAASETYTGLVSPVVVRPGLAYRRITSLVFSSMPTGEELRSREFLEDPVSFSFYRGDEQWGPIQINPRCTFRWVPNAGYPVVDGAHPFRMLVEPCNTHTSLFMEFDVERDPPPLARLRCFTESYKWESGKLVVSEVMACDPRDGALVDA
jgi:hypothetical protein